MPKEFINNRYYGQHGRSHELCEDVEQTGHFETCAGTPVALDDSAVKVGWSKEAEHVEIAVVHHRDGAEGSDESEAWHSQFDRIGLNRLIRTLRQARDDAFGKDE